MCIHIFKAFCETGPIGKIAFTVHYNIMEELFSFSNLAASEH